MAVIERAGPSMGAARRPALTGRQQLMLLLAFEILVLGFAQATYRPIARPGILIETTVTPNHVVT